MSKLNRAKKGAFTLNDLASIGITFVVTAIVLGLGATILQSIQATVPGQPVANGSNASYAYNITGQGLGGVSTLASYLPTIALVSVAAVVIGVILVYFSRRN